MTDQERKAMEMAFDALIEVTGWQWAGPMRVMDEVEDAIEALRQALAQSEQDKGVDGSVRVFFKRDGEWVRVDSYEKALNALSTLTQSEPWDTSDMAYRPNGLSVEQEPVGIIKTVGGFPDSSQHTVNWLVPHKDLKDGQSLFTAPPSKPWVSLSDEDTPTILAMADRNSAQYKRTPYWAHLITATEEILRSKNNG